MKRKMTYQKKTTKYNDGAYIELKESFVRWQDYTKKQLSFANYIFLTFAIGIMGFVMNSNEFKHNNENDCLQLGNNLLFISIMFGTILVITRLVDFKYTARITNEKRKQRTCEIKNKISKFDEEKSDNELKDLRNFVKFTGRISWFLFCFQLFFLFLGSLLLFYHYNHV